MGEGDDRVRHFRRLRLIDRRGDDAIRQRIRQSRYEMPINQSDAARAADGRRLGQRLLCLLAFGHVLEGANEQGATGNTLDIAAPSNSGDGDPRRRHVVGARWRAFVG